MTEAIRVAWWGTYDLGKPRCRIFLRGLRRAGADVIECHADLWRGIEDKSRIRSFGSRLRLALRWSWAYVGLLLRYLLLPAHDLVFIGYLGIVDVLVIWPWARLRRVPIVWDLFISTFDTVVVDREMVRGRSPIGRLLYGLEWIACRAADLIIVENAEHGRYLTEWYRLPPRKVRSVFTGVEPEMFPARRSAQRSIVAPTQALYFGQLIPLHGIQTYLEAAGQTRGEPIRWVILGTGQHQPLVESALADPAASNLFWKPWIPYKDLHQWIQEADVCVGTLGTTEKAARVIPNKVFQVLSCGVPLVTRDCPAIRELLHPSMDGVFLIAGGDPRALAEAVRSIARDPASWRSRPLHRQVAEKISPDRIGETLRNELMACVAGSPA